jgi:hypothetical protein
MELLFGVAQLKAKGFPATKEDKQNYGRVEFQNIL